MQEQRNFINGNIYHIYNRGVAKQNIFKNYTDYQKMLERFAYYLDYSPKSPISDLSRSKLKETLVSKPKKPVVKIVNYCLMPNHFHLILEQLKENGISQFTKDALNSYSRYFNTKHKRIGPIFQGRFKAIAVDSDEQLIIKKRDSAIQKLL